jgi:outer membrane protein assembly factor BamD
MAKKYNEAISYIEIFVKTHPIHEKVPYAVYMLGLINYEQMPIIERDQETTVAALSYFNELCERYPKSKYVANAKKNITKLRRQIAGKEVYVARYYQGRENYTAAIGRLNTVIDLYMDTIHVPEAMHRLVECYVSMGLLNEAKSVYKVLKREYPNSIWAKHSNDLLKKIERK